MRVVARSSELVVDHSARLPGRGAWLHPTNECFRKAVTRNAFGRALKVSGTLDTTAFETAVRENRLNGTVTSHE
jgi:predicted RNA-binding protein YlxR (DUF448 family)